jgi:hypothetical protein
MDEVQSPSIQVRDFGNTKVTMTGKVEMAGFNGGLELGRIARGQ